VHFESGVIYTEPGIPLDELRCDPHEIQAFRAKSMFFGGVQIVGRDTQSGELSGAGDPRRGGVAVAA
jgi:gamma-glutamyltranspeptidase/glutathione hydrolase